LQQEYESFEPMPDPKEGRSSSTRSASRSDGGEDITLGADGSTRIVAWPSTAERRKELIFTKDTYMM
jgi:hypothetical protein